MEYNGQKSPWGRIKDKELGWRAEGEVDLEGDEEKSWKDEELKQT